MTTFFAMNGYGFYIWSAYGAAALVLAIELLTLRSRRRSVLLEAVAVHREECCHAFLTSTSSPTQAAPRSRSIMITRTR